MRADRDVAAHDARGGAAERAITTDAKRPAGASHYGARYRSRRARTTLRQDDMKHYPSQPRTTNPRMADIAPTIRPDAHIAADGWSRVQRWRPNYSGMEPEPATLQGRDGRAEG